MLDPEPSGKFADLGRLVAPDSVALVGASDRPTSLGNVAARNLLRHSSFSGRSYLVTDRHQKVLGRRTIASLEEVPEPVDVLMVLAPRAQVPDLLELAESRGDRFAIVMSSGFAEADDTIGSELDRRLRTIAGRGQIRIVGPNCPGIGDVATPIGLTIQPGFQDELSAGSLGVVAQSGGLTRCILQAAHRNAGFSYFFSPGNQVDLDIADFVAFLGQDDDTKVIVLAVEAVPSGRRFIEAVTFARSRGKSVVMLKVGSSNQGRVAAASHTGSIVGSHKAMQAVADDCGIVLVEDVNALVHAGLYLERAARPRRSGVAVVGMSGGAGVVMVDALAREGLFLADLSAETLKRLRSALPESATPSNPVDLGASAFAGSVFRDSLEAVANDAGVGSVVVIFNAWYEHHTKRFAEACIDVAANFPVPVLPVWMSERDEGEIRLLDRHGLPPSRSASQCAKLTRSLVEDARYMGALDLQDLETSSLDYPPRLGHLQPTRLPSQIESVPEHDSILEYEAKGMLRERGIRTTREQLVSNLDEARTAANVIGYPVIAKVLASEVIHRRGTGFVSTRIEDDAALLRAWRHLEDAVELRAPDARCEYLVSEYIAGTLEAYIGFKRDPEWGPILSVGLGGEWIEEIDDVNLVAFPATREKLRSAVLRSKLYKALRKEELGDVVIDRLTDICIVVGELAESDPPLLEVDLNPVILSGDAAIVVDALFVGAVP